MREYSVPMEGKTIYSIVRFGRRCLVRVPVFYVACNFMLIVYKIIVTGIWTWDKRILKFRKEFLR